MRFPFAGGRRANYVVVSDRPFQPLVIRDVGPWDEHPSVTNDAEGVVERLVADELLPLDRVLLYYDSIGDLSRIKVREGRFDGFASWNGPVPEPLRIEDPHYPRRP